MEQPTSKPSIAAGAVDQRTSRQKLVSALAQLKLIVKIILAIGYVYFEIWLWGLIRQFKSQHLIEDQGYATLAFMAFPITALYNGLGWYFWSKYCRRYGRVVSNVEAEMDLLCAKPGLLSARCILVAGLHLRLIWRLDQWRQNFEADGKIKDANICTFVFVVIAVEVLLLTCDLGIVFPDGIARMRASREANRWITISNSAEQESEVIEKYIEKN
ncbi:hypothetical protein H0G86_013057 [Trichoderma simmonsii]|uniref:Uncharacterized protein n=1 Tax=Trichoderma simmonsii TaxID=1491479 RepID=A0A8G0LSK7_9HYPO|nr:hypothetical protein H0G86_013057 [Trichoderma simmonsii]